MNTFDNLLERYGPLPVLLFCLLVGAALVAVLALVRPLRVPLRAPAARPGLELPPVRLPAQRRGTEQKHHA